MTHYHLKPRFMKWIIIILAVGSVFIALNALACPFLLSENTAYDCVGVVCPVAHSEPQRAVFAIGAK